MKKVNSIPTIGTWGEDIFPKLSWFKSDNLKQANVMVVGCGALGNEVIKNLTLFGIIGLLERTYSADPNYENEHDLPIDDKDKSEVGIIRWRLNLRNLRFIAQFKDCGDKYEVSDVRRSDFSKLIMHNNEQLPPFFVNICNKLRNGYYEFTWKIQQCNLVTNEYEFTVDEKFPIVSVSPKEIVDKLHKNIMGEGAPSAQRTVRSIDTLKTQLTASGKEIFIYELLQNANDYPQKIDNIKQPVDVEFHITDKYLIFMHTGAVFSERNIAAICDINDKDKTDNTDTIGYCIFRWIPVQHFR